MLASKRTLISTMICNSQTPNVTSSLQWRQHDVFISFRGSDVRNTFVDHLRAALRREGIRSFSDRRDLARGENLKEAIPRAIERSRFCLVVFSPNYASSEWCLDELVTIMRYCSSTTTAGSCNHVAIPIFYHVTPEGVSAGGGGCYKEEFDRHKSRYSYQRVDGWLQALAWIAHISGWVVPAGGWQSEAQLVERIAKIIMRKKVRQLAPVERPLPPGGKRNNVNLRIVTVWGSNNVNCKDWRKMGSKRYVFIDDSSDQYLMEGKRKVTSSTSPEQY